MGRFLENKVCIITGAAQGIGKSIAERFAGDVQAGENAGCKASIQIEMNKPYALLDALKTII